MGEPTLYYKMLKQILEVLFQTRFKFLRRAKRALLFRIILLVLRTSSNGANKGNVSLLGEITVEFILENRFAARLQCN